MTDKAFYVHGLIGETSDTGEEYVVLTSSVGLNRGAIEGTFTNEDIRPQIDEAIRFEPDLTLFKMVPVGLLSEAYEAEEVQE